ncbi:hypothetical protein ACS0TY_022781 [Phlomoides rotata]
MLVYIHVLLTVRVVVSGPADSNFGHNRFVEFGHFQTSGVSILVHSVLGAFACSQSGGHMTNDAIDPGPHSDLLFK